MNKIGLHNAYWLDTEMVDAGVYKWMELAKQANCEVMEIGTAEIVAMTNAERLEFKKAVADAGMILTINDGFTKDDDIAAEDPAVRRRGIERAKRILQAMYELGADRWSGINYSEWLRHPEVATCTPDFKAHVRDLSLESMREIIKIAEDCGVDYCFEVVNRFEQFLLNTAAEGVQFCEDLGSPRAKLLLDTFHMNIEEDNIADAIKFAQSKGRLGHIHVGESNRRVPGFEGKTNMDWDAIMGAVKESGYEGYIIMEPFMKMGATTICCWRDMSHGADIATMVGYAKDGAAFLRSKLA